LQFDFFQKQCLHYAPYALLSRSAPQQVKYKFTSSFLTSQEASPHLTWPRSHLWPWGGAAV